MYCTRQSKRRIYNMWREKWIEAERMKDERERERDTERMKDEESDRDSINERW